MFSPEFFYTFVRDNLAPSVDDTLFVPRWDGAKKPDYFEALVENKVGNLQPIFYTDLQSTSAIKPWLMYDQEPLDSIDLSGYRSRIADYCHPILRPSLNDISDAALLATFFRSQSLPILCHSHKNCSFLHELESYLWQPCYYWYHAFVSRDWFRFWQYDKKLQVQDRSEAPFRFLLYARDRSGTRAYRSHMVQRLQHLKKHICYDWEQQQSISSNYSAKITVADAEQSSIHLVAETVFYNDGVYLTEKIFRPIVMSQPFIVFGPPGTLAYLKSYGFKTFDHVWSESYDHETNHDARLEKLLDLVQLLADLSNHDWQKVYQRCLPVLEYNRRRFFATQFMDDCLDEFKSNLHRSLLTRDELASQYPGGSLLNAIDRQPDLLKFPIFKGLAANISKILKTTQTH